MKYTDPAPTMIVVIAPYPKLKETADSLAASYGVSIRTCVGDLGAGLALAREALAEDAILVSRGGTAKLIRETLGVDVIEIGISQFDLLRTLKPFIGGARRIAVAGFRALTEPAEEFCEILGIPAVFLPVDDEAEMPDRVERISKLDVACLVGDMVALRSAAGLGIPLALIESGRDAVAEALDKAAIVARSLITRRESDLRLRAVLNTVRDGIVAVDRDGIIAHINRTARELLNADAPVGMPIEAFLTGHEIRRAMSERREVSGKLVELGERRVALDLTPIVSKEAVEGAVLVLQEIGKIQDIEKKVRRQLHEKGLVAKYGFRDISSLSPSMGACLDIARQYARSSGAILIYGETGTGKELLAQSIHNESAVRDGPFVAINCGALPPTLLESELFGYAEGAFTGAGKGGKTGLFELAHGGTIFLDEINELDIQLQGKLLRVLQEREVMRVGGLRVIPVSFRLIAASNVPLHDEMERGKIRADLYYRLNVLDIRVPPLRDRIEDILPLFTSFASECARRDGNPPPPPPPRSFQDALGRHDWPGNVRELENVAEKWTVLRRLLDEAVASQLVADSLAPARGRSAADDSRAFAGTLDEIEQRAVRAAVEAESGNISKAARRLGVDRQTLRRKLGA